MRAAILFTITQQSEERDEQALAQLTNEYMDYVCLVAEKEKWTTMKLAVGIHKNAARLHTHIEIVVEMPDSDNVKFWNKKLQALFKFANPNYECRRTMWKDDHPKYNEDEGIAYLLKEFTDDSQIILKEKFKGITTEEMHRLRRIGNEEYVRATAERERTALRKQAEDDEGENIVQFIRDFTSPKNRKNIYGSINNHAFAQQYLIIKIAILEYYQMRYEQTGKRGFKAYSIRDKAISYMTTENICTKLDLATFLN